MTIEEFELLDPVHCHRMRVLYGDTDSGGVVYYANYLRFCEAGRSEYMRELAGISYREIEAEGFLLPVVDCRVRYKSSGFYDDIIRIESSLVQLKKVSCRFNYRISREDGTLLALAYTVHAVVNRQGKLSAFPKRINRILADIQKVKA